jgi:anhydro-N-acetylmuramic acid kinase
MDKELYIGVMSGTSLDGIDIALCEIDDTSCKLIKAQEFPFNKALKDEILDVISNSTNLKQLGTIDAKLGYLYANAIHNFIQTNNLNKNSIKAIGLHGQTLWHEPEGDFPFSMQLGDANRVVAKTGLKTVADFRGMDIANGGQGAPFAPAFHQFIFGSLEGNIAVLNIGGMANITILGEELQGWDTGCGNVLLDMWISQTQQKAYDREGAFARSGTLHVELLETMLEDAYFKKQPPKSTGREYFNQTWLANYLPLFNTIPENDIQRTLLELTAKTVANDINATQTDKLIICGGGSKNGFLMQRLDALTTCEILISDALGVSSDSLEAMAFAWFAYKRVHREIVALHSVTGAKKDALLGAMYG